MKKTVLVTGASRGIGKSIAEKFLNEGYKVYGTYFSSFDKIEELQEKFGKENLIICGPYDFRKIEDTNKLVNDLAGIELDSIICNAGIFLENDDFLNFDYEIFNQTMNCNFYTPLLLATKLQNNIKNNGSIIIMSSNDAYNGAYGSMSYSISKAAVLNLTKCLCVNYGRRGIRVNSVAPGAINTDMNTPEQEFEAPQYTPIERIGQPDEVAEVVYFLTSSSSSFINGENITIDGGYGNVSVLLKNEVSRIREYKGYDYIYEKYKKMNEKDILLHISPCAPYTYIDNEEERTLLKENLSSEKNGATIYRILIVDKEREQELKNSNIVNEYFKGLQPGNKMYLVKKEDIIRVCPNDYQRVGLGYGIFNNNEAFVDSYSSNDSIGYRISGEKMVNPLVEAFNNILYNIENGNIRLI